MKCKYIVDLVTQLGKTVKFDIPFDDLKIMIIITDIIRDLNILMINICQ